MSVEDDTKIGGGKQSQPARKKLKTKEIGNRRCGPSVVYVTTNPFPLLVKDFDCSKPR